MISSGVSLIYSGFMMNERKKAERLAMELVYCSFFIIIFITTYCTFCRVKEAIETVSKIRIPDWQKAVVIEIMAEDQDNEDVDTPYIRYVL